MLALKDVRRYISGLGIAADDNVYVGKLDNKKQRSIGVYGRPSSGGPEIALGGLDRTTYDVRRVSLLVHWTPSQPESEAAACELFEKLGHATNLTLGNAPVNYLRLMVPEPQDVGTDDGGVREYVIWLDFIHERKR